jgi:hypothetical protein
MAWAIDGRPHMNLTFSTFRRDPGKQPPHAFHLHVKSLLPEKRKGQKQRNRIILRHLVTAITFVFSVLAPAAEAATRPSWAKVNAKALSSTALGTHTVNGRSYSWTASVIASWKGRFDIKFTGTRGATVVHDYVTFDCNDFTSSYVGTDTLVNNKMTKKWTSTDMSFKPISAEPRVTASLSMCEGYDFSTPPAYVPQAASNAYRLAASKWADWAISENGWSSAIRPELIDLGQKSCEQLARGMSRSLLATALTDIGFSFPNTAAFELENRCILYGS